MRLRIQNLFILPALIAVLNSIPAGHLSAQTFTTLHSFTELSPNSPQTNSDGASPRGGLILSGNTLYGTAYNGGSSGNGAVFAVNTDGTCFTNLHIFTIVGSGTNSDGSFPVGGLILSGNTLYGTAAGGGLGGGTVFAVNTNGTGFTNLHNFAFAGNEGTSPQAGLILSGNTLYGTASQGGSGGYGTVFAINTDGTGFTNLSNLGSIIGGNPYGGLILSGSTLYGTASRGGGFDGFASGTVFAVNTNGTGTTFVHFFYGSDGANPRAGLILSSNTLYGTTPDGGLSHGTVFAVNTNRTFTHLHNFLSGSDASGPIGGLVLSGNTLYGTASQGGSSGAGAIFAVNTDSTGYTNVYSFTTLTGGVFANFNSDGGIPYAGLILSGNTLYGTAQTGGTNGSGTVFSLSLPPPLPQLTILHSGANVVLTWPTNAAGFALQSTTNLVSPAVWGTNLPSPVVVSGQNNVTNSITGTRKFYRLSQ